MTVKPFNLKAVIKELESNTQIMGKIFGFYDDPIENDETPNKPYIFISIISDNPDPIETMARLEFRIISHDEKTSKATLREIDNLIISALPEISIFNDEFEVRNIIIEDAVPMDEPKGRISIIRDFLFYYIN